MNIVEMIKEELSLIGPTLIKDLNIIEPTYSFNHNNDGNMASCEANVTKQIFAIVDIEFSGKINFDPVEIKKFSNLFQFRKNEITRSVIRYCIYHEHRHAWQFTHDKVNAMASSSGLNISILPIGMSNIEEDANLFAISKTSGMDKHIAELQRLCQRFYFFTPKCEKKKIRKLYLKIVFQTVKESILNIFKK